MNKTVGGTKPLAQLSLPLSSSSVSLLLCFVLSVFLLAMSASFIT